MPSLQRVALIALVSASSCTDELRPVATPSSAADVWHELAAEAALDSAQRLQVETANAARERLASTLVGELTAAMRAEGPEQAIAVCQERAPAIAAEVGQDLDVRIGRTSTRLRNGANVAPVWAAQHVADGDANAAWFAGPEQQLGAVFPIRLQPQCITCHGSAEQLPEGVRNALAKRYPDDRATGYASGDLRGWFWVEVPAGD